MAEIYRTLAILPLDQWPEARDPVLIQIAILIFDRLTALDAIGPYEVLRSVPGWEVKFVGPEKGQVRTDSGALGLSADYSLEEVGEADIVLVPGGEGNRPLMDDEAVLSWLRRIDAGSKWTTSVCTGALVLGAAGLLEGKRATSHWLYLEQLRELGADPVVSRFVEDGKVITAAGVSAGIDMALHLVGREVGPEVAQAVQLIWPSVCQAPNHQRPARAGLLLGPEGGGRPGARRAVRLICAGWLPQDRVSSQRSLSRIERDRRSGCS